MSQKNQEIKIGQKEKQQEKKLPIKRLLNNIGILAQLSKRMALKLYLYNKEDEIFKDGTFDKKTLETIKKEARIIMKALKMKKENDVNNILS